MDPSHESERIRLADHLRDRREALLARWRIAIRRDPRLTTGDALPRTQLNDHIPAVLAAFEERLRAAPVPREVAVAGNVATAHGLQRWQQGYDLHEVVRELGLLNEVMVAELDAYAHDRPAVAPEVMRMARAAWATTYTHDVEQSSSEYFRLQRVEAAGHVRDLEQALRDLNEMDLQRTELWRQMAHDLRSNVGVVASATYGLQRSDACDEVRDRFLRMLDRNVRWLRHLLDDVTDLAKLHAGSERRQLAEFDVAAVLTELCDGMQAFAQERGLYLRLEGPPTLQVEGDSSKVRRIAQNLVLNALKYTQHGGVSVRWEPGEDTDGKRWKLSVADTGPGFRLGGAPMTEALKDATERSQSSEETAAAAAHEASRTATADADAAAAAAPTPSSASASASASASTPASASTSGASDSASRDAHLIAAAAGQKSGEGIGLSIVKRLTELLDATVEVESRDSGGTTFRVLFPLRYSP
ncbi:MAG: ATP-binding protein [Burkholderiaceae bacterium]